ncbi:MAG: MATE family efflux transporter [Acidaminobacteraceae bacterium]
MNDEQLKLQKHIDKKAFTKKLLYIAVPITIQSLITASVNLIDTMMVGKLGESSIAALGVANQYYMLFHLIIMALYSGVGIFISQYWGKKDSSKIKAFTTIQLQIGMLITAIFVIFGALMPKQIISLFTNDIEVITIGASYLRIVIFGYVTYSVANGYGSTSRSIGRTVLPMIASVVALVVNIFLNYGLIYGNFGMPALGVEGAAIATASARAIEMLVVVSGIYISNKDIAVRFGDFLKWNQSIFNQIIGPMSQVVLNDICWGLGMIVYTMIYVRIGTGALASIQIMTTVQNLFITVVIAVSIASCVMIGNQIGEGNHRLAKEQSYYFIKIVTILTILIGIFVAVGTSFILSFFTVDSSVMESTKILLYISAISMPARGLGILFVIGILRGGGDASGALKIELFTMWIIGVPGTYITAIILGWPIEYVYIFIAVEELLKLVLAYIRFKNGRWLNDFTQG